MNQIGKWKQTYNLNLVKSKTHTISIVSKVTSMSVSVTFHITVDSGTITSAANSCMEKYIYQLYNYNGNDNIIFREARC